MLTIYCPNPQCARPNHYALDKPSFCGFCGSSLGALKTTEARKPDPEDLDDKELIQKRHKKLQKKNRRLPRRVELQEESDAELEENNIEEDDDIEMPDISALEYEIQGQERPKLTFAELAKQKKVGFAPRPFQRMSQQEAMEQFQKEAQGKSAPIEIGDSDKD